MKIFNTKIIAAFLLFALIGACKGPTGPEGPPGPQGPRGPQGEQGPAGENAFVMEYDQVHFTAPDFYEVLPFADDFDFEFTYDRDHVLVYALWDFSDMDVWRLLPQTTFQDEGTLVYNFDHTLEDVALFLDANFDIAAANLGPAVLDDWVIRIVVIPGDDWGNARTGAKVDYSDYNAVKEYYNLEDLPIRQQRYERPKIKE